MYVVETDAPCRNCGDTHLYVTQMCNLCVFVDYGTARYIAGNVSGSVVREIDEVPEGLSFTLYLHRDGRPDRAHARTVANVPRG